MAPKWWLAGYHTRHLLSETLVAEGDDENRSIVWSYMGSMRAREIYATEQDASLDINPMNLAELAEFRIDWYVRELREVVLLRLLKIMNWRKNYIFGRHPNR